MIEMRWIKRDIQGNGIFIANGKEMVLQYRAHAHILELELGIQKQIWSEWQDVPIVDMEQALEGGEK